MNSKVSTHTGRSGFSLVELIFAIAIFSVAIIVLMSLLTVGVNSNAVTFTKTSVTNIASAIVSDFHSITPNHPTSSRFGLTFPKTAGTTLTTYAWFDQNGNPMGTAAAMPNGAIFRATILTTQDLSNSSYKIRILVTWPAVRVPDFPGGKVDPSSSYLLVTFLQDK